MAQNLQKIAKFQKFQLDNLVDFEKYCKTRIYLQRSAPIEPKTSEILTKLIYGSTTLRVHYLRVHYPTHLEVQPREGHHDTGGGRGERLRLAGRAELRALKEGALAKCRIQRNWYRFRILPDASRMRSGCVGILNSGKKK